MFEDKDDEQSVKRLEYLEQLYTLGEVNFDSVIIIDFGSSLKSINLIGLYRCRSAKYYLLL